jgi:hypothetical protein
VCVCVCVCVWGGGGFKTGARPRDAANGRKQKCLSLVKELKSIRYPVSSSLFRPFFGPSGLERSNSMHTISVPRHLCICIDSYVVYRTVGYCASYSEDAVFEFQHE